MSNLNLTLGRLLKFCNPVRVSRNIAWRYRASASREPHVFVLGAPRSGTTLTFKILSSNPAFCAIDDETYFLVPRDVFNDNCKGLTSKEIKELRNQSKDIIELYDNLANFIIKREGGKRFLEKTPMHVLYLRFLTQHFPNAKFINMIRDGRDCYVSHKRLDAHLHSSITRFACLWRDHIVARQRLGQHPQIMDITYEELTGKPWETSKQIMNFLGEDFLEEQINPKYYSNTNLLKIKGHDQLSKPINSASIGRWREKMTSQEIAVFNRIAGKQLKGLGYEVGI